MVHRQQTSTICASATEKSRPRCKLLVTHPVGLCRLPRKILLVIRKWQRGSENCMRSPSFMWNSGLELIDNCLCPRQWRMCVFQEKFTKAGTPHKKEKRSLVCRSGWLDFRHTLRCLLSLSVRHKLQTQAEGTKSARKNLPQLRELKCNATSEAILPFPLFLY